MPLSREHGCLFVHIPKTGGTSIESALGMHGPHHHAGRLPRDDSKNPLKGRFFGQGRQHLPARVLKRRVKGFDAFYKFSFVRNPWDRLVSAISHPGWATEKLLTEARFKEVFWELFSNPRSRLPGHFRPQHKFLLDSSGVLLVDFVGRFENLERDFGVVCENLGIQVPLEHRMKSNRLLYWEYFDGETREVFQERFAKDIELFGYAYGDTDV